MNIHFVPLGQPDNLFSIPLPSKPGRNVGSLPRLFSPSIRGAVYRARDEAIGLGLAATWAALGLRKFCMARRFERD